MVGVTAINAPVLRPVFTKAFWCGQQRRDAGRATEDHLAHPPGANLVNRGFYKDTVLGWLKSTATTGKTWITTGTTAITLFTTTARRRDEESPRDEEDVALRDLSVPDIPAAPSPTLLIQGYGVSQGKGTSDERHDRTPNEDGGIGVPPPCWDRPSAMGPGRGGSESFSYLK